MALVHALNATPGLNFPDAGDVGTTPENFNPNITQYDDDQVLLLIAFYSDNFGIRPEDDLRTRRKRLLQFFLGSP